MSAAERKLVAQSIEQCVVEEKLGKYFLVQEAFLQPDRFPHSLPNWHAHCALGTSVTCHGHTICILHRPFCITSSDGPVTYHIIYIY